KTVVLTIEWGVNSRRLHMLSYVRRGRAGRGKFPTTGVPRRANNVAPPAMVGPRGYPMDRRFPLRPGCRLLAFSEMTSDGLTLSPAVFRRRRRSRHPALSESRRRGQS